MVSWQDAGNCCSLQDFTIPFGSHPDRESYFLPVQYFQHGRLLILAGFAACTLQEHSTEVGFSAEIRYWQKFAIGQG